MEGNGGGCLGWGRLARKWILVSRLGHAFMAKNNFLKTMIHSDNGLIKRNILVPREREDMELNREHQEECNMRK